MICEKCGRAEARLIVCGEDGGGCSCLALCADCAGRLSADPKNADGKSFLDWLETFVSPLSDALRTPYQEVDTPAPFWPCDPDAFSGSDAVCPLCGTAAKDLAAGKRPGCPECYCVFGAGIFPDLVTERDDGGGGPFRLPLRFRAALDRKTRAADLRAALSRAVASEDFEEAAVLRDRIRSLETPTVSPDTDLSLEDGKEESRYAMV